MNRAPIRLPDAWTPPAEPAAETMAREADYAEGSAMERAFCVGVDMERLRARMGAEPAPTPPDAPADHRVWLLAFYELKAGSSRCTNIERENARTQAEALRRTLTKEGILAPLATEPGQ